MLDFQRTRQRVDCLRCIAGQPLFEYNRIIPHVSSQRDLNEHVSSQRDLNEEEVMENFPSVPEFPKMNIRQK